MLDIFRWNIRHRCATKHRADRSLKRLPPGVPACLNAIPRPGFEHSSLWTGCLFSSLSLPSIHPLLPPSLPPAGTGSLCNSAPWLRQPQSAGPHSPGWGAAAAGAAVVAAGAGAAAAYWLLRGCSRHRGRREWWGTACPGRGPGRTSRSSSPPAAAVRGRRRRWTWRRRCWRDGRRGQRCRHRRTHITVSSELSDEPVKYANTVELTCTGRHTNAVLIYIKQHFAGKLAKQVLLSNKPPEKPSKETITNRPTSRWAASSNAR